MRNKILSYLSYQAVVIHGWLKTSTQPWQIGINDMAAYPTGTLGNALYNFYTQNKLHPIPKMEYHDAEHLILGLDSDVKSEILLQCFVLGNGKKTFFATLACIASISFFPEMWFSCLLAYKKGKTFEPIWHIDFRNELSVPLEEVRKKVLRPLNTYHQTLPNDLYQNAGIFIQQIF